MSNMLLNRPLSSYFFFETGKCIACGLVFNDWQIKRLLCLEIRCVGHAELENIVQWLQALCKNNKRTVKCH